MTDDIAIVRQALQSAKNNAFLHRRGGLHKLWDQILEGIKALDRIEQQVTTTQMSLFPISHNIDAADYQRGT